MPRPATASDDPVAGLPADGCGRQVPLVARWPRPGHRTTC